MERLCQQNSLLFPFDGMRRLTMSLIEWTSRCHSVYCSEMSSNARRWFGQCLNCQQFYYCGVYTIDTWCTIIIRIVRQVNHERIFAYKLQYQCSERICGITLRTLAHREREYFFVSFKPFFSLDKYEKCCFKISVRSANSLISRY